MRTHQFGEFTFIYTFKATFLKLLAEAVFGLESEMQATYEGLGMDKMEIVDSMLVQYFFSFDCLFHRSKSLYRSFQGLYEILTLPYDDYLDPIVDEALWVLRGLRAPHLRFQRGQIFRH